LLRQFDFSSENIIHAVIQPAWEFDAVLRKRWHWPFLYGTYDGSGWFFGQSDKRESYGIFWENLLQKMTIEGSCIDEKNTNFGLWIAT